MIPARHVRKLLALSGLALCAPGFALAAPAAPASTTRPSSAPAPSAIAPSGSPGSGATADGTNEAERLVTAVEARHAKAGSLSAQFTQTFRSAATGQQLVERGRMWVKRPGQMRFDYRQPDKKVFIVRKDGTTLSYVPADYTAVKGSIPPDAPHLRLLMGSSQLLDGFIATTAQLKQPVSPNSKQLKLTPKKPTDGVEVAYLEIDPTTLGVLRVLVIDPLGNESDLVLERISDDARVQDDVFQLQLPPGVTLREGSAAGGP